MQLNLLSFSQLVMQWVMETEKSLRKKRRPCQTKKLFFFFSSPWTEQKKSLSQSSYTNSVHVPMLSFCWFTFSRPLVSCFENKKILHFVVVALVVFYKQTGIFQTSKTNSKLVQYLINPAEDLSINEKMKWNGMSVNMEERIRTKLAITTCYS